MLRVFREEPEREGVVGLRLVVVSCGSECIIADPWIPL